MMLEPGLKVRRNRHGLAAYLLFYALVMQPVCVWGYWSELLGPGQEVGHQVMRGWAILLPALLVAAPALAAPPARAVGTDLFVSTDADRTDVVKAGLNLDWSHEGPESYFGMRLEKALVQAARPALAGARPGLLRAADSLGGWKWNLTAGPTATPSSAPPTSTTRAASGRSSSSSARSSRPRSA